MNRAQRRQLARQGGWRGKKARAKSGGAVSESDGVRRRLAQVQAEQARKDAEVRDDAERMGLWLPG